MRARTRMHQKAIKTIRWFYYEVKPKERVIRRFPLPFPLHSPKKDSQQHRGD